VTVVDLRRESGYPLSGPLLAALAAVAEEGRKAILLINRRGLAPALHCRACGRTRRCVSCDVALVLHADRRLHCHHCGHAEPSPALCPDCGSAELVRLGAGTEGLERELADRFPGLPLMRLDADTAAADGRHGRILEGFAEAPSAVLLGTQMVAKGHHFDGVALAAVVDADLGLALPDFRAEERTFQLVTQLAGRSGRDGHGRVIVQTFAPDARPIALAARHAVDEFLAGELERRRELGYPPYRRLVRVLATGPTGPAPLTFLRELRDGLAAVPGDHDLLGPAPLLRLRGRHRAQLLVKADDPRPVASRAGRMLAAAAAAMRRDGLTAVVDVDPQSW
jgi:primosomal protein N' (replication factor Y)